MKIRFLILFFIVILTNVNAQNKQIYSETGKLPHVQNYQEVDMRAIHFGFTIGFNTSDFITRHNMEYVLTDSLLADVLKLQPGFHVNIVTDYRIGNNLSIRFLPGLVFGQRNLIYTNFFNKKFDSDFKLESNMLDFPLLVKYKSKRINNYRPYMIAGGNVRVDMAAKRKYDEDQEIFVKLNKLDFYYEIGMGCDFYNEYFKFSTELKLSVGLRDIMTNEPYPFHPEYVNVIDRMTSSLILFSMHFE